MTSVKTDSQRLRRADGSPLRVLVVDDEAPLAELLSMALRLEGWEVRAGDAARLHQVLGNLLANARTHTPPGTEVTVRITPLAT